MIDLVEELYKSISSIDLAFSVITIFFIFTRLKDELDVNLSFWRVRINDSDSFNMDMFEINNSAIRNDKPSLPEVSEHDLVMHYSRLAHRNFAVDVGFYPLGSCTMKYNPRFADYVASLNTFANSHPSTPSSFTQGNLEVRHQLENILIVLCCTRNRVTFQMIFASR